MLKNESPMIIVGKLLTAAILWVGWIVGKFDYKHWCLILVQFPNSVINLANLMWARELMSRISVDMEQKFTFCEQIEKLKTWGYPYPSFFSREDEKLILVVYVFVRLLKQAAEAIYIPIAVHCLSKMHCFCLYSWISSKMPSTLNQSAECWFVSS